MQQLKVAAAAASLVAAQPIESIRPIAADSRLAALRGEIVTAVGGGQLTSVSVGALDNGRLIWLESFGFADREAQVRATPRTRYGLASLGKSITATALMTLVEARQVRLDATVPKVLGSNALRNWACDRPPTVRQLLNMTAGIPHGAMTFTDGAVRDDRQLSGPRSIAVFCPGEVYHYSNYSIAVADQVVEAVSGLPFGEYLDKRLFGPLQMREASLGTPAGFARPAARYDDKGARIGPMQTFPRSSRGLNASLLDLLNYAAFHLKRPVAGQLSVLSHASLDEMHLSRPVVPGSITALGWGSLDLSGGKRWLITNGNDLGVQATLLAVPHAGVAVVVLSNSSGGQTDEFAVRAADILAPGLLTAFEAAKSAYETTLAVQDDPAWVGVWNGKVETSKGPQKVTVTVSRSGEVEAVLNGQPRSRVENARLGHGLFTGHFRGLLLLDENGRTPHHIDFALHRKGAVATGFLTANFENESGKFEIPIAVRLKRRN